MARANAAVTRRPGLPDLHLAATALDSGVLNIAAADFPFPTSWSCKPSTADSAALKTAAATASGRSIDEGPASRCRGAPRPTPGVPGSCRAPCEAPRERRKVFRREEPSRSASMPPVPSERVGGLLKKPFTSQGRRAQQTTNFPIHLLQFGTGRAWGLGQRMNAQGILKVVPESLRPPPPASEL